MFALVFCPAAWRSFNEALMWAFKAPELFTEAVWGALCQSSPLLWHQSSSGFRRIAFFHFQTPASSRASVFHCVLCISHSEYCVAIRSCRAFGVFLAFQSSGSGCVCNTSLCTSFKRFWQGVTFPLWGEKREKQMIFDSFMRTSFVFSTCFRWEIQMRFTCAARLKPSGPSLFPSGLSNDIWSLHGSGLCVMDATFAYLHDVD